MRDPESVVRAQRAAAALERAWQRWRAMHGVVAGPRSAISSYVGSSFEEPYGEPRVVFGLSAQDAEHLVALLDRHDCAGPVHAMVAVAAHSGSHDTLPQAGGQGGQRPAVPRQAPQALAQIASPDGVPAGADDDRDHDGPVFRQAAAAVREAAAARAKAAELAVGPDRDTGADDTAGGKHADHAVRAGDAPGGAGTANAADGGDISDETERRGAGPMPADGKVQGGKAQGGKVQGGKVQGGKVQGGKVQGGKAPAGSAPAGSSAVRSGGHPAGPAAGDPPPAPDESSGVGQAPATDGSDEAGPGPLALAACAARIEAEVRIKAVLDGSRLAGALKYPYGGVAETTDPIGPMPAGAADIASARLPVRAPRVRPEAASGAQSWPSSGARASGQPGSPADVTSEGGVPESGAGSEGPAVVPFRPRPELAAYLDAGPEPDETFGGLPDSPEVSHTRRNRVTRGYSIPRLSRTKRPGAVPGT